MQVTVRFLLACELVSRTAEGKLNLMGEFNRLTNPQLPVVQPMTYIAARIEANVTAGLQHAAQLIVTDEDGDVIWKSPTMPVTFQHPLQRGLPMRADIVLRIGGMMFPKFGTYSFTLWIDGTARETIAIFVQEPEEQGQR